ncbi:dmX-like protein 1 isoform X2 [Diabrotica virgifera virgifera]|uniref:RAVE complex protein Rav1 C-terminal domain-containing protein n=1 Tax=Diabrotica virgifera virgifera TaxID=50390 RepID=A0ABM5KQ89_DIAVI|nr:dmX-like protein 1 isoform X2 [Diabrotica virgifera virgifera]
MNLHQIVSGACNAGDKCFAVGSVEGVPFTAYAAGCNIVILASNFERVQIIPGAIHDYIRITSIDCSSDTGKIAASYDEVVCIYEPTPLIHNNSLHGLDYRWVQTGTLKTDSATRALSWNLEGTRLLTAGTYVQLWHLKSQTADEDIKQTSVTFTLGGGHQDGDDPHDEPDKPQEQEQTSWQCVWKANTAIPVQHLAFSPDGTLFATCGENDRLVKIWYENRHVLFTSKSMEGPLELDYSFVYIAHPRAVTHISWRTTSKYMPKGSVSNMLVTSCKDNICRLWVETVLPEDGLVNLSQLDPQAHHPKFRTHRHKHRFMQRLKHMKTCFHIRRNAKDQGHGKGYASPLIPTLPSTYSVHDFHSYGYHGTGITPGLHFHLAASVNAETDIPLVPSINYCSPKPAFVLHWLDNKEMQFSLQAELFLEEFARPVVDNPDSEESEEPAMESGGSDGVDVRIESFLRDWHHSPDLLFSIHPVDGSFLIWVVEWLDEFHPGSFRQAQVSFSTRIPSAFPLGDSMSMSTTVSLYNTTPLLKHLVKDAIHKDVIYDRNLSSVKEEDENKSQKDVLIAPPEDQNEATPVVSLVTKHDNGTLNLWQITFADKSKFSQVLSIGYKSRASGHRFRVNDITCHPVLPLLLTTSHHNIIEEKSKEHNKTGFCSELILWKVDAVGPLSKSGGICELARISSPEPSAFSNVAWIPTLLPSTTLGNLSNSPSACFVASDGQCLRVYQAVIDARTLLADLSFKENRKYDESDGLSDLSSFNQESLLENINIVSQQSTSRPGCIIQLETVSEAIKWQNTTFLHVYQEQLITGQKSTPINLSGNDAMVDLQQASVFKEPFFIVLLDCTDQNTIIHMWKLIISSTDTEYSLTSSQMYVPDSVLVQDENDLSRKNSLESLHLKPSKVSPHINLTVTREIKQILPLSDGVEIVHATPAAGHLSSASIYPACLAPYCFATACTDGIIRFWTVSTNPKQVKDLSHLMLEEDGLIVNTGQVWSEWNMIKESAIEIEGQVLNISVAYSGRLACAYKYGKSFTRPNKSDQDSRFINLCVAIYECESTGGSEWILEDVIHLKNIHLPRIDINKHLDLSYLYDSKTLKKKQRINEVLHTFAGDDRQTLATEPCIKSTLLAVPSFTTLQSLRKSISEKGNICPLTQKHIVQLDWVSNEDGSHILTVAVGSKIMLYTPLSTDLAQANVKAMKESLNNYRPILRKASSLAQPMFVDDFKWMTLRKIELQTADGLPALPMQISWVRDGILVVGMDSEMHVYTQWKPQNPNLQNQVSEFDGKNGRDVDFRTLTQENQKKLAAVPTLGRISSVNLQILDRKRNKEQNVDYMPDYGLFEASRIACPVLPQYHPKQLMELLNSGKIRWVKAILAHLVKCIGGNQDASEEIQGWTRSRTLSVSYPPGSPEHRTSIGEINLDYDEINNIPPLPLWTLLAADKESSVSQEEKKDYNELFDSNVAMEDSLDNLLEDQEDQRRPSERNVGVTHFTPKQGRILSRLLTHIHLPGLSSLDQMHLLALADTVATCNTDLAERFAIDAAKSAMVKENLIGQNEELMTENLDDCGLRFLLAMKHYGYLLRCLPLAQRTQFQKQGVGNNNLAWAFHSESQEELLNLIPSYAKGEPTWPHLRELGVGWWIRNLNLLKTCVQVLAKASFQVNQDPMDAALYYLALNKKNLLWGLYRSKRDERMTAFFSNNFTEDRWRKAALKNAYALLGKQRFDHAAAFFLLAGNVKDAVEICLHRLQDLQLALIIVRIYQGDGEYLKKLLYQEILGRDENGENQDMTKAHPDPFLRSMALWTLKEYQPSLDTLLVGNAGTQHPAHDDEARETKEADPNVFNFYVYLRTHPLLVRQHLSNYGKRKVWMPGGKQIIVDEWVTPLERQLYFATAHGHFRAGCPALALEVLSKLPFVVSEKSKQQPAESNKSNVQDNSTIATGTVTSWDSKPQLSSDIDWGAPVTGSGVKTDDFELKWSDDEHEESEDSDGGISMSIGKKKEEEKEAEIIDDMDDKDNEEEKQQHIDIMAQQLKFVACLKILMEELSTLATGFEVDGGQLRYQLYMWLEKEVEALRELCNYTSSNVSNMPDIEQSPEPENIASVDASGKPTLHEILVQEKLDFEAKVQRAAKRKRWLRANETLLRTLLSYCSLHGATGGLASVRMELMLLLQELQQEKTHQQLLSPLPFPTSLPLLAASVASSKTVVADPIRYLQCLTHDMLQTLMELQQPHTGQNQLLVIRDLAIALSACIYQSLCDSDTFKNSLQEAQEIGATFLVGRKRRISVNEGHSIITIPSKWPGVTSLRSLLAREKDDDTPRLTVILCESFTAVYLSLVLYGLVTYDCIILFHVNAHIFDSDVWGKLFGGGIKKLLRTASLAGNHPHHPQYLSQQSVKTPSTDEPNGPATWLSKQRVKLNTKLLGQQPSKMKEDKPTYREQFVPPEMSILAYLLQKPATIDYIEEVESDIEEEDEDEDVFDAPVTKTIKTVNNEHSDPNSYSWLVLRLATLRIVHNKINEFLAVAGLETSELPVASPLIHSSLRKLTCWQESLKKELESKQTPPEYIPGCFVENSHGPVIQKYRQLLEPHNTPFSGKSSAAAARHLWTYLVRQESVQDIFIRAVFGKRRYSGAVEEILPHPEPTVLEPVRIIHKEQDSISAFSLNQVTSGLIAIATPRELQEMDISLLLELPAWLEDECELDILNFNKEVPDPTVPPFLVIQSSTDKGKETQPGSPQAGGTAGQSGRGTSVMKGLTFPGCHDANFVHLVLLRSAHMLRPVLKHKIDGIKRITAHPLLPLYLTGGQDGSVHLWEWGHQQPVAVPRPPGTYAKVTRVRFSQHGNKFGVADSDGNLSLFQVGLSVNATRPFFTLQCHNKGISDFVFLGSCSLLATAGHSSESKNVCIWDSILPHGKALVMPFTCHDQGASSLVFAPQHQVLISAGKKGDVCLIDVRSKSIRHKFSAHESAVKCIAIDPHEDYFATGSADGDIKIWGVTVPNVLLSLPAEHARSSFFKNIGQGVTQLHIDNHSRLFSCGADGSMKVRQLPERESLLSHH